jgi:type II secretory pathway pseudopilin PulG
MKQGQQGFTVIEAMIGITVFTIISLAMAGTFVIGYRAVNNEARVIAADSAITGASMWLTRDLNSETTMVAGTIQAGSPMTLNYGSPPVTVTYSVDANTNLIRTVAGNAEVAARGVTSVAISWTGCYGTASILPSATGATAVVLNVSNRPGGCF